MRILRSTKWSHLGSCLLVLVARLVPVSNRARVDFDGLELGKSFVDTSKESLDPVVPNLVVADVIQMFRAIKVL